MIVLGLIGRSLYFVLRFGCVAGCAVGFSPTKNPKTALRRDTKFFCDGGDGIIAPSFSYRDFSSLLLMSSSSGDGAISPRGHHSMGIGCTFLPISTGACKRRCFESFRLFGSRGVVLRSLLEYSNARLSMTNRIMVLKNVERRPDNAPPRRPNSMA
jgi:hypothetical protein